MVDIRHRSSCDAPVEVAFAYIDDYRNTTRWMFGLSKFVPVGGQNQGLGAEFDGTFAVKPIKLSSRVRITEWVQDKLIALESVKGFRNTSRWEFAPDGPERTAVSVVFSYDLPGGLAGRALGKAMEPVVALSVRHTDESLRKQIEARYADAQG